MPAGELRTVVASVPGADRYVLLTYDLDVVHTWGGREALRAAGVADEILKRAEQLGSAQLDVSDARALYPWEEVQVQFGDLFVDRSLLVEFCEAAADDGADLWAFFIGSVDED